MKVTVNNRAVDAPVEQCDTLSTLLDRLRERGRIPVEEAMVSLEVDGRTWRTQDMENLDETSLTDVRQVAISTADMRGYAARIMTDSAGMLTVLLRATREVADKLRNESAEMANAHLFDLLDALHQLFICLLRVQNACGLRCRPLDSEQGVMERMTASLRAIRSSQETENWDTLAHQLEEDLLPAMEGFAGAISTMREELENGSHIPAADQC